MPGSVTQKLPLKPSVIGLRGLWIVAAEKIARSLIHKHILLYLFIYLHLLI